MRLNINKACDLNSISVLPPPPSRRLSAANSVPANSIHGGGGGGGQHSVARPRASQQSFSQGISSQHGMFSQFSQSSHEDVITTDQRFGSQDRDHSAKRISCLAPPSISREESQMPISRSSNNLMRKWSSNSSQDHKGQSSEEFEQRMTMIEISVSRIGMILDSVQNDAMQGNKGTKELSLLLDVLRQKTTSLDESIHQLNRRQEDVKTSLEGGLKSIFDQLNKSTLQDKSQEILPVVRTLPDLIEGSMQRVKNELWKSLYSELQGNKGTKELSLQLDVLRQKTTSLDESIHQLNRRQEDVKTSLEGALKSIFDQLNKSTLQDKSQEILPVVRTLPDLIEGSMQRVKNELWKSLYSELQEITCSIKASNQQLPLAILPPKPTGRSSTSQVFYAEREPAPVAISKPEPPIPKMETGGWKSVKAEKKCSLTGKQPKEKKQRLPSIKQREKRMTEELTVLIDSDEDFNQHESIFLVEKDKESCMTKEAKEETLRILRKARRRRKRMNTIVID